ncbi:uroporphyrinogen decarboxylase [Opitutales bacterium]|nr:uroporphyrinogen decarboxylase [Opitutales bacterium]MDG1173635.1 uroporphyrinogen decarboxylase [Opitutales bacterium]
MNGRTLFNAAIEGKNHSGRPPLWVMRQAGRYLPEYRALKEKYSFVEMVKNPELATEVTLQPLKRFPLDAAIVFSDILVIPEAMGQEYAFRPSGGIEMKVKLKTDACIEALNSSQISERLAYVEKTLKLLRKELGNEHALLGFCGSPWTLACYMIEGGSAEGFPTTIKWAKERPESFVRLLEKISEALVEYIKMQAECGIDALQIFDSWQALCPDQYLWDWSLKWIKQLVQNSPGSVPIIVYANSSVNRLQEVCNTGCAALGVHHSANLLDARMSLPKNLPLQGNLNPELMETDGETVKVETLKLLDEMKMDPAHILNLGHGIRPGAKIECMESLVETTRNYSMN